MNRLKNVLIFLSLFALASCGFKSTIETHDKAHREADFIIENFNHYDEIKDKLPKEYFELRQVESFVENLAGNCDWENRKGKYVDYFPMKSTSGHDKTAFIYEYCLDCDSIRIILIYNMIENAPELFKITVEPLEKMNPMIIDPSKQLLVD